MMHEPTGPIDMENDSEAVQGYKAGRGAFVYALTDAGWTEEQITNSLQTHFEGVAAVLTEHQQRHVAQVNPECGTLELITVISPKANPCGRGHCDICTPEETH